METTDRFLASFIRIETTSELKNLWETSSLLSLLNSLVQSCELDLAELIDWISERTCPFDSEDIITEQLELAQLRRRLGNLLLYKSFKDHKRLGVSLVEYIQKQRAAYIGKRTHSDKLMSLQGFLREPRETWITSFLTFNHSALKKAFRLHTSNRKSIEKDQAKHIFRQLLEILKLKVPDRNQKEFFSILEEYSMDSFTFKTMLYLLNEWASQNNDLMHILDNSIEKTLIEFRHLQNMVKKPLDTILNSLILDLNTFAGKKRQKIDGDIQEVEQAINVTFSFYAKAIVTFGTKPSFEDIESNNTTLSLPKFVKFCYDFELLKSSKYLSKETAISVFKKVASNGRLMTKAQFVLALDHLAESFFNENFDLANLTDHAYKTPIEKKELLYSFLGFYEPSKYLQKVKGFGLPFSSDKETRISQSSSYNFKINSEKKKELDEWKRRKAKIKALDDSGRSKSVNRSIKPVFRPQKNSYSNSVLKKNIIQKPLTFRDIETHRVLENNLNLSFRKDEEDNDFLKKLYGDIDLKYSKIIQQQDHKINRGLNVLRKGKIQLQNPLN